MVQITMVDFEKERKRLVNRLIEEGILRTHSVIRAMLTVPREEFVLEHYRKWAYIDTPLPILCNQTISAPHMCAIMCEALELKINERVLEIGTGSGYHAALCAEIVSPSNMESKGYVVTVEYFSELAKFAKDNLKRTGYDDRVYVINADGSAELPFHCKFDKILVTAAAPKVPNSLLRLLKPGGRMVIPVGTSYYQTLILVKKTSKGDIVIEDLGGCLFVPLRGKQGFEL